MELTRIHKQFQQYFRVVPASTPELQAQAYRVRHQVYCRELGWEPLQENEQETDQFDKLAHHCLLQNVNNDEFVGCIRMVMLDPEDPMAPMPFQLACKQLREGEPDTEQQRRQVVAEVSRLAVIGKYRRRPHEQKQAVSINDADFGTLKQPRFPYIPIGLYLGLLEMARINGIETLYILTEPGLARHFCKLGGKLEQIGEPIEHRGTRAPYKMEVNKVIADMSLMLRPLFKVICKEVHQGYSGKS
ncbi:PEP-CTERM/exosortase system-associated acyltransferase [Motiliproteus sp.]|uniref:PEP-CTERM/exosortase system-associated acyltransferase n=1 Tax=Motiliproteus sp. TaxID=1898955 RepID=UPI003BAC352B